MSKIERIGFLGSGAVASFLAEAFYEKGFEITQVWSRTARNAKLLAERVGASPIEDLGKISSTDLLFVAIVDDAIANVVEALPEFIRNQTLIVHTSGIKPFSYLSHSCERTGLFYPLNTFTKEMQPNARETPFYVNTDGEEDLVTLQSLARAVSPFVYIKSDREREVLHLAAVFASNFSNGMYEIADTLLKEHEMSLEQLHPLMKMTLEKVLQGWDPEKAQTGPAVRGDQDTISRHITMLEEKDLKDLYLKMSKIINPKLDL